VRNSSKLTRAARAYLTKKYNKYFHIDTLLNLSGICFYIKPLTFILNSSFTCGLNTCNQIFKMCIQLFYFYPQEIIKIVNLE
jgi:hypothetical protein